MSIITIAYSHKCQFKTATMPIEIIERLLDESIKSIVGRLNTGTRDNTKIASKASHLQPEKSHQLFMKDKETILNQFS